MKRFLLGIGEFFWNILMFVPIIGLFTLSEDEAKISPLFHGIYHYVTGTIVVLSLALHFIGA